jgi:hypothetical protein
VHCLALLASTTVAFALFVAAAPHWLDRRSPALKVQRYDPQPEAEAAPPPRLFERREDPADPREWRYFLGPHRADALFSISGNSNLAYDPWTYVRDAGNVVTTFVWVEHPRREWTWKSNSLGCREDHELDDPPRDIRVLVAGDSHTCGVCSDDESFANLVEAQLAHTHAGRSVEVLNAGLGGYTFLNYLGTFLRFRSFAPEVFVVAVFGGNDFAELLPMYLYFAHQPWSSMTAAESQRRDLGLKVSPEAMGQGMAGIDTFRTWPWYEAVMVRASLQICEEMKRVAENYHSKLIVVFIPCPFDFAWRDPPQKLVKTRAALELRDSDMRIPRDMSDAFLKGLAERGITTLDMRPIFEREPGPPYWRADFHLDVRGHELVARELRPLVDAALADE